MIDLVELPMHGVQLPQEGGLVAWRWADLATHMSVTLQASKEACMEEARRSIQTRGFGRALVEKNTMTEWRSIADALEFVISGRPILQYSPQ